MDFQKYSQLCTRLGRSKKTTWQDQHSMEILTQHKGRRVPLYLQDRVQKELEKLVEDKQTIKLEKCSDKHFISPVVITVKKRQKHENCLRLEKTK